MASFAFLALPLGLVVGFAVAWFLRRGGEQARVTDAEARGRALGANEAASLAGRLSAAQEQLSRSDAQAAALQAETAQLREINATLAAQVEAEKRLLEAERARLEQMQQALPEAFRSTATRVLAEAQTAFENNFNTRSELLQQKEQSIDGLLQPVKEVLAKMEQQSRDIEQKREKAYGEIGVTLQMVQQSHDKLHGETSALVAALRRPGSRGSYGEAVLELCLQHAGLHEGTHYSRQTTIAGEDGRVLRPDIIVKLPKGGYLVIDAKTPFEAFDMAFRSTDEAQKKSFLERHAATVRNHMNTLNTKSYAKTFAQQGSPEVVICFLPSEGMFAAALEADPQLPFHSRAVTLASPTTLLAMLRVVECSWQNLETAKNATEIREQALKVYEKLRTATERLTKLGNSLRSATEHYNGVLTTVQGRGGVFSIGRRLRDLRISNEELDTVEDLTSVPEQLTAEDWLMEPEPFALSAEALPETEAVTQP